MKRIRHGRQSGGFSLLEAIIVAGTLIVLLAILLLALAKAQKKTKRINCSNNLKQIGLSFRLWAGDNNDKFPDQVSVTNGGTMELVGSGMAYVHFLVMSNELSTPRILVCPTDTNRFAATNWNSFGNGNLSYFVGLDAAESYPQMFLSGDRNLEIDGVAVKPGVVTLQTNNVIGWTREMHKRQGNVALADGSVQGFTGSMIGQALRATGAATNRLAMP